MRAAQGCPGSPRTVIPGLDPGIHGAGGKMDAWIKSGHDSRVAAGGGAG